MAVVALISPQVTIAGVNMSAFITKVEFEVEADDLDTTNFGSGGWRTKLGGLKKGTVKVSFNDDFAATTVDDRLWAWFGTVQTFNVKATTAANSATNPEYQMSALVNQMSPLAGKVGELANQDVNWPVSGVVTRAVV
jgi:predicted secreted protein